MIYSNFNEINFKDATEMPIAQDVEVENAAESEAPATEWTPSKWFSFVNLFTYYFLNKYLFLYNIVLFISFY